MLCVHLGPGRLGLGLVVDTLLELDLDICLVGAHGRLPSEVHEHEVVYVASDEASDVRSVRWVANPQVVDDLHPDVVRRLGESDAVLVTGSLAHEAAARENFLRELLERRPADAETVVLACENDADPMYATVVREFPHVHYCACVVDRIVNWNRPWQSAEGRRRLVVHRVAQWVISHPAPAGSVVMTKLNASPVVHIVGDEDLLAGFRKRRQWAVNGGHLFMALITKYNDDDVPLTLQDEAFDELRARVMPLITVVLETIARAHPQLAYDRRFVEDRLRVFRQTPNSTTRILEDRLVRADLRLLMSHFDTCIGDAAREAHQLGMACDRFEEVVDLLLDTIDRRSLWFDEPQPEDMHPLIDAAVVGSFQTSVAHWMDPTRAHEAADRLSRMLAIHRQRGMFLSD